MLYLARIEEEELQDLSCTDVEQQWGALRSSTLSEYEPKHLIDLCHVKSKKSVYVSPMPEVTEEIEKEWVQILSTCAPLSEYSIFHSHLRKGEGVPEGCAIPKCNSNFADSGFIQKLLSNQSATLLDLQRLTAAKLQSLSPVTLEFYKSNIKVALDECVKIASEKQGTDKWMSERNNRISASKARAQYTYFKNPNADWKKRYDDLYHSKFSGTSDTIRGIQCEGIAREAYEDKVNCKVVESGFLVRPELPWLGASLDGTMVREEGSILCNIEIKTVKEGTRLSAAELRENNAVKTLDNDGKN